jgi:hypothetical protein
MHIGLKFSIQEGIEFGTDHFIPEILMSPIKSIPTIIAFDPGLITGYATYFDEVVFGYFDYSSKVDQLIQPGMIVVYEKPFQSVTVDPVVFEVKGAIVERANTKGCTLVPRRPSCKEFVKHAYKLHDRLIVDHKDHSRDACAHLMDFMMKEYKITAEQFFGMIPRKYHRGLDKDQNLCHNKEY